MQVARKKILVIYPGALGDFVCFLPALEKLAKGKEVDLFARAGYVGLVPPHVTIRSVENSLIARLFVPGAREDVELKNFFGPYAEVHSWMGSGQPDCVRNLEALAGGKLKIFPFLPSSSATHVTHYYLSCVGEEDATGIFPFVSLRAGAVVWIDRFWQHNRLERRKVLVLAPGSGAKEKNWPADFYQQVAEWWERKVGGRVLIILGPVEEEKQETGMLLAHGLTVRGLELPRLCALLTRSDLYLGNDSGTTHLAAALGVRTVALFGPTDVGRWAPQGKRVKVVSLNVECCPCEPSVMKGCPHRKCLTTLTPQQVIQSLEVCWDNLIRGLPVLKLAHLDKAGGRV